MQLGLILLPVAAYALLTIVFRDRVGVNGWAEALVKAHLALFTFVALSTEALSLVKEISLPGLLVSWLSFLLICVVWVLQRPSHLRPSLSKLEQHPPITHILVSAILLLLVITFITALLFPPNTWDSMTYHMPRVVHWMNQNSLDFYPTQIARQLNQAPLAEYMILHLQVLSDGDRFANLVQWISFVLATGLGSLIAAELGLNNRQQLVASVLVATLPMAVLQASSTQNDLVVAVFLMSFTFFLLRMRHQPNAESTVFAGIALGLALLTKGTAYVYAAALGPCLAIPVLLARKDSLKLLLSSGVSLVLVVCIALSFSSGHYWRNYQRYGHPMANSIQRLANQDMSGALLAGNLLRNLALHSGTPFYSINRLQYWLLQETLGSDLNHPATTLPGTSFRVTYERHEDLAGNLLHTLIALISLGALGLFYRRNWRQTSLWYAAAVLLGAFLYCWLLRWQPWASRLHTPLFLLAAPLMAMTITAQRSWKQLGNVICILLVLYSLPYALDNTSRSLRSLDWLQNSRERLYFVNKYPAERNFSDYRSAVETLERSEAKDIGLFLGGDDWEYPIWVLSGCTGNHCPFTFRSVGAPDPSGTVRPEEVRPPYVIATRPLEEWAHAPEYLALYRSESISVFKRL